jgi:hypothetical protein
MFQHACTQFALLSGAIFKPECHRFSGLTRILPAKQACIGTHNGASSRTHILKLSVAFSFWTIAFIADLELSGLADSVFSMLVQMRATTSFE